MALSILYLLFLWLCLSFIFFFYGSVYLLSSFSIALSILYLLFLWLCLSFIFFFYGSVYILYLLFLWLCLSFIFFFYGSVYPLSLSSVPWWFWHSIVSLGYFFGEKCDIVMSQESFCASFSKTFCYMPYF